MRNAFCKLNGKVVVRYNIITTPHWVYTVYEETDTKKRQHHTLTGGDPYKVKGWLGGMASRELPEEINRIPVGPERLGRVREFRRHLNEEMTYLINMVFPETLGKNCDYGDIEMTHNEPVERGEQQEIILSHANA